MNSHARLFHRIAPIYSWFFQMQTRSYQHLLDKYGALLPEGTALDIGCGPGALSHALYRRGFAVTAVDFAPAMIRHARQLSSGVRYLVADGRQLPFPDCSFDLVTAGYVAHGLDPEGRLELYREAARLSGQLVLLHDYNLRRNPLSDLVEWLEGGNYFSFLRTGIQEMEQVFTSVKVVQVGPRTSWYLCSR